MDAIDNDINETGIITVIQERFNDDAQGKPVTTHINDTEILTIFDDGSPVPTIRQNAITEAEIVDTKHKEKSSQDHRVIIHPSGKGLFFPFNITAKDDD